MVDLSLASTLMQGDFMEGIVHTMMGNMITQLKAEYQKELLLALQAAKEDGSLPRPPEVAQPEAKAAEESTLSHPIAPTLRAAATANEEEPGGEKWEGILEGADAGQQLVLTVPGSVPLSSGHHNTEVTEAIECIQLPNEVKSPRERQTEQKPPRTPNVKSPRERGSVTFGSTSEDGEDDAKGKTETTSPRKSRRSSRDSEDSRHSRRRSVNSVNSAVTRQAKQDAAIQNLRRLSGEEEYALKMMREEEKKKAEMVRSMFAVSNRTTVFADAKAASQSRMVAIKVILSPKFDLLMGLFIVSNVVTIGYESTFTRVNPGADLPLWIKATDYTFLFIYSVELVFRTYAVGIEEARQNTWVRLDALLVFSGLLNLVITVCGLEDAAQALGNVNMLKMIRLFRLARVVRLMAQFRTLWMLVQGLMSCVMPMFWTSIIMMVVLYVFAIAGMELIVDDSTLPEEYGHATKFFDTIFKAMVTLMQFLTLDSINLIYRPLVLHGNPILTVYFLVFFLIGPIALLNIITAIQVEGLFRTAGDDHEAKKAWESMKRKTMMPKLRSIFAAIDVDESGEVDLDELLSAPEAVREQLTRIVDLDQMEEVFRMLDFDGSGSIDIDEFVDGIMRSQQDKPTELILLMKQSKAIVDHLMTKDGGLQKGFLADNRRDRPETPDS